MNWSQESYRSKVQAKQGAVTRLGQEGDEVVIGDANHPSTIWHIIGPLGVKAAFTLGAKDGEWRWCQIALAQTPVNHE